MYTVCNNCGSYKLKEYVKVTLFDKNDHPWQLDSFECLDCEEITIVTYESKEKLKLIGDQ